MCRGLGLKQRKQAGPCSSKSTHVYSDGVWHRVQTVPAQLHEGPALSTKETAVHSVTARASPEVSTVSHWRRPPFLQSRRARPLLWPVCPLLAHCVRGSSQDLHLEQRRGERTCAPLWSGHGHGPRSFLSEAPAPGSPGEGLSPSETSTVPRQLHCPDG